MTITEALTYVKNLHNEGSAQTPNWSDAELYAIFQAKANFICSKIGMIEGTDTSITTVAGTAAYTFPTNFVRIRRLEYNGRGLKYVGFRAYEARKPTGVMTQGLPREFVIWNNQIILIPTPSTAGDTLTIYGEKQQSAITGTASTIDLPSIFHQALCDLVISEMFIKDENVNMATFYRNIYKEDHLPIMMEFAQRRRRRGMPSVIQDADSVMETEFGVI